jgi:hypothetical protein
MGELFDLILDFERKFIHLLRDLLLFPRKIVTSILEKNRTYISAFKFFSISLSLWIIFGQFWFTFIEKPNPESILPDRIIKINSSYEDFEILILPVVILFEYFIPIALINSIFFRKRELSTLNHIALNIYIAGMLLLYALPVIGILLAVELFTSKNWVLDLLDPIAYLFLCIVPAIYYGMFHLRIFGSPKFLNFIKSTSSLSIVVYLSFNYLFLGQFHSIIHRKLYYMFSVKTELQPELSLDYYKYENRKNQALSVIVGNNTKPIESHSFIQMKLSNPSTKLYFNNLNRKDTLTILLDSTDFAMLKTPRYSINEIDTNEFIIIKNRLNKGNEIDFINLKSKLKHISLNDPTIAAHSKAFKFLGDIYITGFDINSSKACIQKYNQNNGKTTRIELDKVVPGFLINDLITTSIDSTIWVIGHIPTKNKVKEIHILGFQTTDSLFKLKKDIQLLKNDFSPQLMRSNDIKILAVNDTIALASFQIKNDSTFTTSISCLNILTGEMIWSKPQVLNSDFSISDQILFDQESIYMVGRAASLFRNSIFTSDYYIPYIKKISITNGTDLGVSFLGNVKHEIADLSSFLNHKASGYKQGGFIYYSIDMVHFYQINVEQISN